MFELHRHRNTTPAELIGKRKFVQNLHTHTSARSRTHTAHACNPEDDEEHHILLHSKILPEWKKMLHPASASFVLLGTTNDAQGRANASALCNSMCAGCWSLILNHLFIFAITPFRIQTASVTIPAVPGNRRKCFLSVLVRCLRGQNLRSCLTSEYTGVLHHIRWLIDR